MRLVAPAAGLVVVFSFLVDPAAAEPRHLPAATLPPPAAALPFVISSASTTWVLVGQNCDTADTVGSPSGQSTAHVWCFEGAGGANTWPEIPPEQNDGSRHTRWDHWSHYAPPEGSPSRWHVTTLHAGPSTGGFNAWCGCDSADALAACEDVPWWIHPGGYGDDWNYALTLDMIGQDATAGGTVRFDLRYDAECNYDYVHLEYYRTSDGTWRTVTDGSGNAARFNGVSGNVGPACGNDYFGHSGTHLGVPYYGNSVWLTNVTFPLPAQTGGMMLRWRATSDGAWSDQDGYGDTDGLGAVDNVLVTFAASGVTVTDDFESGDFTGVSASSGGAMWIPGGLEGNTYDGWHLEFDPKYKNKGNTCTFSDDWMWAAKPAGGSIPTNGFDYVLATPVINVSGWTDGVLEYSHYHCTPDDRADYTWREFRLHEASRGWSPWTTFDEISFWDPGCLSWDMNRLVWLSDILGPGVDSLQVGFRIVDGSQPGDFTWGQHGGVQYLVDNVSIGSFDVNGTRLTAQSSWLLSDTFSRVDPAHSASLGNSEEGRWVGNGGSRPFESDDSLTVWVSDPDGVSAVDLHWRVGAGTPPAWGAWNSKPMVLTSPFGGPGEGAYTSAIGNVTTEDYSADEAGSLGNAAKDPIWDPGQTVQYYVRAMDALGDSTTLPASAESPSPGYLEFSILPMGRQTPDGVRILIVDDWGRPCLDFQNSHGFQAGGGAGFGSFTIPAHALPHEFMERSLYELYSDAGPYWDIYDVSGAPSSIQREPRVLSDPDEGLGGLADALGVPFYDAVVWIHGEANYLTYADTTRIGLKAFLDHGGHLLSSGDDVAWELGAGGGNADSTLGFLGDYLGVSFPTATDDATEDRVLEVYAPYPLHVGLYGECPSRLEFDKLTESPDVPGVHLTTTFATYESGDGATNGRAAIIRNDRVAGGGVALHCGFSLTALVSDCARGSLLHSVFQEAFGLPLPDCMLYIPAAPESPASGFAFTLAPPSPTPFTGSTQLTFSVPARSVVSIDIYNVLGQRVRTLVHERMPADRYVREWDGLNDDGRPVPTGIYFVTMKAGDFSGSRKVVRLR